jgi:NAD(P)-dependent dehydrogenase (short-subunit alcohol dehydrogenase family)
LDGTVALVTGGADGIGKAVVRRYIDEGAEVGILDRNREAIDRLRVEVGDELVAVCGDVTSAADNRLALQGMLARYGKLDVFVGNAGIYDFSRPLGRYSAESLSGTFDEIFGVNVKGYLIGAAVTREALRRSGGSMIFTVSNCGLYAGGGGVMYVASKHAVVGIVRQLAFELAPEVRVNGVAPGGTLTGLRGSRTLNESGRRLDELNGIADRIANAIPLGFAADPEDHAGHYVLLASKANSRATTGAILCSDGGWEIRSPEPRNNTDANRSSDAGTNGEPSHSSE